jgi:DNA methylase
VKVLDQAEGAGWTLVHGDSAEVLRGLPESSVHFSCYSPPFASLYTYSASERDMGNCRSHGEFFEHFAFLMPEMLRVTRPGRNMSVHCMDIPMSKVKDGEIGLHDFPGELVRAASAAGWIWHSRVTIWKDPVTQMQRTKALGLLHKQIRKDSCMSRMGLADYVLTFRKPGVNTEPVSHTHADFPVEQWQKWASPIWGEGDINPSDTLQYRSAREDDDERHIAPLQLEVIRRCVRLWSNPGDVVLSPFAGIGSEGYVAVEEGRKYVGVELKRSYYEQAVRNLKSVEPGAKGRQVGLFAAANGAA